MSDSSFDLLIKDKQSAADISLPVSHEKLGGFISSLLGQSQSIERELYGTFNIDHSWLLHVHSLLEQRIRQQNHATLTDFKAVVFYSNRMKRTLNSVEAFEHFNETKKIVSQSIRITWTYLIDFPHKELPEKQEISIYISAKAPSGSIPEDSLRRLMSRQHKVGFISYRINYTERTWGDDLEMLLKQELDQIMENEPENSIGSSILGVLGPLFFIAGFTFPEIMNEIIQKQRIDTLFKNYESVLEIGSNSIVDLGGKLDLLLHVVDPNNTINTVGLVYRLLSIVFGFTMFIWCVSLRDRVKPSFVVLTKTTEDKMTAHASEEKKNYLLTVMSFMASIFAGVLGNYIYYILTTG